MYTGCSTSRDLIIVPLCVESRWPGCNSVGEASNDVDLATGGADEIRLARHTKYCTRQSSRGNAGTASNYRYVARGKDHCSTVSVTRGRGQISGSDVKTTFKQTSTHHRCPSEPERVECPLLSLQMQAHQWYLELRCEYRLCVPSRRILLLLKYAMDAMLQNAMLMFCRCRRKYRPFNR
jgi:hypothetical protein